MKQVGQYIVDEPAGQLLLTANIDEGGNSTAFWARLKVDGRRSLTEMEMYNSRSRADIGIHDAGRRDGHLSERLDLSDTRGRKASREELYQLGQGDIRWKAPGARGLSRLPADGGRRRGPGGSRVSGSCSWAVKSEKRDSDERVPIPAGLGPGRPSDPKARVVVIDEEQGIVVAMASFPASSPRT